MPPGQSAQTHVRGYLTIVAVLTAGLLAVPQVGAVDTYAVTSATLDSGGVHTGSADYSQDGSLGGIAGVGTVAMPAEVARQGYIGQLYEVTGLALQAAPDRIGAGGTSQLSGTATLDDGTWLPLEGADLVWDVPAFPIVSISASGLATAGTPTANTLASVGGSYLGVSATALIGVVIQPPVAADVGLTTPANTPLSLLVGKLLALCTSPDGFALSLTAISNPSAQGGGVLANAGLITYTPPIDFSGSDQFTYSIDDGHGGTAQGTVSVTVGSPSGTSPNVVSGPTIEGGDFVVRFAGVPGFTYTIERAETVTGPWQKATNVTAPTTNQGWGVGVFQFSEPTGGATSVFYRTVYPAY